MGQKYEALFERVYAALTADEPQHARMREELELDVFALAIQARAREMDLRLTYPACREMGRAVQRVLAGRWNGADESA
jgi:hypothetical protein